MKDKNKDINFLQTKINNNVGISSEGVCCYLIE